MSSPGPTSPRRTRRLLLCVAIVGVIPLGLAARFLLPDGFADLSGGALYAVLIYLLIGAIKPGWTPLRLALLAFLLSCAVELLQLTSIPGALSAVIPPIRLVVGTTFSASDVPAYAVGALLMLVVDCLLSARTRGRHSLPQVSA